MLGVGLNLDRDLVWTDSIDGVQVVGFTFLGSEPTSTGFNILGPFLMSCSTFVDTSHFGASF